MNKIYVSIKEAIEKTGMSDASLRRLCRKGLKGRDYKHDIDGKLFLLDSFLYSAYPALANNDQMPSKDDKASNRALRDEIAFIKDDLSKSTHALVDEKDKRIEDLKKELMAKDITIHNLLLAIEGFNNNMSLLSERTREQNIIIQSLQEKFSLQINSIKDDPKISERKFKIGLIDKLLIGVAILASLAILTFLGMMLLSYLKQGQ
jgi:hypothetical protein